MKVWLLKEPEGGAIDVSLEEPQDMSEWTELSTREVHYEAIALMLERMSRRSKSPARRQVAWNLAKQLRRHVPVNNFCH